LAFANGPDFVCQNEPFCLLSLRSKNLDLQNSKSCKRSVFWLFAFVKLSFFKRK